jgi:hypothetical protein
VVYNALKVARCFSREQIDAICQRATEEGHPVSYRELIQLTAVSDTTKRQQLLQQAMTEDWTAEKVAHEIRREKGAQEPGESDGRGRPYGTPKNFDDVVFQEERSARDFLERDKQVWQQPGQSLSDKGLNLCQADYTAERVSRLKALADLLSQLAEAAQKRAEEARLIHEDFSRSQQELPPPAASDQGDKKGAAKQAKKSKRQRS